VSILTLFGFVAVSTMLVAYALEDRSRAFVLLFSAACGASSVYGFLAGTWPFGVVEAVWTAVALRRWARRNEAGSPTAADRLIACDMTALSAAERHRYDALRPRVLKAVDHIHETPSGFRLRIGRSAPISEIGEWMDMEHRCCPFLDIDLSLRSDGTTWLQIGGSAAIKAFLKEEFGAFAALQKSVPTEVPSLKEPEGNIQLDEALQTMSNDINTYVKQMAEVRHRLGLVQAVLAGSVRTGHQTFDAELIFIQLRKALELIAFGSLCANKQKFSQVYEKFADQWSAKRLFRDLEKVNPKFYPEPLEEPKQLPGASGPRHFHFDRPVDGFMTPNEFVQLYDSSAEVLHIRNPFKRGDPTIRIGYTVEQWIARIKRLLSWHLMHLTDGGVWVIKIPSEGDVQAWPAAPND
jgi:hypothetical protein